MLTWRSGWIGTAPPESPASTCALIILVLPSVSCSSLCLSAPAATHCLNARVCSLNVMQGRVSLKKGRSSEATFVSNTFA